MRVAVVADNPMMGAAYAAAEALGGLTICRGDDDYREHAPDRILDTVLGEHVRDEIRASLEAADAILVVGVSGMTLLQVYLGVELRAWAARGKVIPWYVDTAYLGNWQAANRAMETLGIRRWFAMPDLMAHALEVDLISDAPKELLDRQAAALYPPVGAFPEPCKPTDRIVITHSPGTDKKRLQKGSEWVEWAVGELATEHRIEYRTLMRVPHAESLRSKGMSHIVIDKCNRTGRPWGLGLSGLEGLAAGAVVYCSMQPPEYSADYFAAPPAIHVHGEQRLLEEMRRACRPAPYPLRTHDVLRLAGEDGRKWAAAHVALEPWAVYVRGWIERWR